MPPDNKIGSSTPPRIANHQDIAPPTSAKKKQQTGSLSQHASGASTPIYKPNNNEDLDISSLMAAFSGLQDSGYHDRDFEDTSFQPLVDVAKPKETLTPEQQEIANLKAKLAHKDKAIQDLSNQNKELKGELADLKTQLKDALSTIDKRVNDAVNHAVSNATAQYGSKIDELTNRLNQQQTPPQPQNYMPQNPNPYMQMQNPYMPMPMQSPFFMPNVGLMYGSATQSLNDSIMNMSKNIFENVGSMFYGHNNRQPSPMMMPMYQMPIQMPMPMYNIQPQYGGNQYNPYNNPPPPQNTNQSPNMHHQHNMGNNGMQNSGIPPQQKTQMPVFEEEQEPSYLDAAMNSMKTGGSAGNYANSPMNRRMNTHSFADAILLDSIDNIKQSLKKNYPDFDTNSTSEFIETMSSNYDENQMKDPQFSAINAEAIKKDMTFRKLNETEYKSNLDGIIKNIFQLGDSEPVTQEHKNAYNFLISVSLINKDDLEKLENEQDADEKGNLDNKDDKSSLGKQEMDKEEEITQPKPTPNLTPNSSPVSTPMKEMQKDTSKTKSKDDTDALKGKTSSKTDEVAKPKPNLGNNPFVGKKLSEVVMQYIKDLSTDKNYLIDRANELNEKEIDKIGSYTPKFIRARTSYMQANNLTQEQYEKNLSSIIKDTFALPADTIINDKHKGAFRYILMEVAGIVSGIKNEIKEEQAKRDSNK